MASYTNKGTFWHFLGILFGIAMVSFFIFPFSFTFFPVNTKNLTAFLGAFWLIVKLMRQSGSGREMKRDLFVVLAMACVISAVSFISITYNNTYDMTYVLYIRIATIWLFSAYFATNVLKTVHGYLSVSLVTQYLTAVCVCQCALALMFDNFPATVDFFGRFITGMSSYMKDSGRLFGIGCMLDVAGVRFSGMLVLLGHLCVEASREQDGRKLTAAILAFLFITLVGNMIARTTLVGVALVLAMWGLRSGAFIFNTASNRVWLIWRKLFFSLLVLVPVMVFLYNTNANMRENLRFGFEGFFSLVEKGYWETGSNNHLETMVHWPDNTKTWMIGDGYFSGMGATDPYMLEHGLVDDVFYMSTDIGYCRFIFYFGLIGLSVFIWYFLVVAMVCCRRFPQWTLAFILVFAANLIVWAKVATDVFPVFAIALMVGAGENEEAENRHLGIVPEKDAEDDEEEDDE